MRRVIFARVAMEDANRDLARAGRSSVSHGALQPDLDAPHGSSIKRSSGCRFRTVFPVVKRKPARILCSHRRIPIDRSENPASPCANSKSKQSFSSIRAGTPRGAVQDYAKLTQGIARRCSQPSLARMRHEARQAAPTRVGDCPFKVMIARTRAGFARLCTNSCRRFLTLL